MKISHSIICLLMLLSTLASAQGVKISNTPGNPDNAAILEIETQTQGFLPPRLSDAQKADIPSPIPNGLAIFNTDLGCLEYYYDGDWYSVCGQCPGPNSPAALAGSDAGDEQITANWSSSPEATTYFIDVSVSNTFSSFVLNNVDVGNVLSYVITGLTPGTTYYYRIRGGNHCGQGSSSNVITYATTLGLPAGLDNDQDGHVSDESPVQSSVPASLTPVTVNGRTYYSYNGVNYVAWADRLSVNDCCDDDTDVYPGHSNWSSDGSACGGLDMNCDGVEESQYCDQITSCVLNTSITQPGCNLFYRYFTANGTANFYAPGTVHMNTYKSCFACNKGSCSVGSGSSCPWYNSVGTHEATEAGFPTGGDGPQLGTINWTVSCQVR